MPTSSSAVSRARAGRCRDCNRNHGLPRPCAHKAVGFKRELFPEILAAETTVLKPPPGQMVEFGMSETIQTGRAAEGRVPVLISQRQTAAPVLVPARGLLGRAWYGLGSVVEFLFGVATLIGGLAVLATIPVLQFLSLGYL